MNNERKRLLVAAVIMRSLLDLRNEMQFRNSDRLLTEVLADIDKRYGKQDIPHTVNRTLQNIFRGESPGIEEIINWDKQDW